MLNYLKEKKDVTFFTSIAGLISKCRYRLHATQSRNILPTVQYMNIVVLRHRGCLIREF